ncbi:MAG TPA: hypothetical protein PKK94_13605, partial [Leptospiraceae bacterium]|nr:hypothetical protein [Leptospiraceae bacterium]
MRFLQTLTACIIFTAVSFCSGKNGNKDFWKDNLFVDGLNAVSGLSFFNLLDGYPVIKSGFKSLSPVDFNARLNAALQNIHRNDVTGALRAVQGTLLEGRSNVQNTLLNVS